MFVGDHERLDQVQHLGQTLEKGIVSVVLGSTQGVIATTVPVELVRLASRCSVGCRLAIGAKMVAADEESTPENSGALCSFS